MDALFFCLHLRASEAHTCFTSSLAAISTELQLYSEGSYSITQAEKNKNGALVIKHFVRPLLRERSLSLSLSFSLFLFLSFSLKAAHTDTHTPIFICFSLHVDSGLYQKRVDKSPPWNKFRLLCPSAKIRGGRIQEWLAPLLLILERLFFSFLLQSCMTNEWWARDPT